MKDLAELRKGYTGMAEDAPSDWHLLYDAYRYGDYHEQDDAFFEIARTLNEPQIEELCLDVLHWLVSGPHDFNDEEQKTLIEFQDSMSAWLRIPNQININVIESKIALLIRLILKHYKSNGHVSTLMCGLKMMMVRVAIQEKQKRLSYEDWDSCYQELIDCFLDRFYLPLKKQIKSRRKV
jgi:hypothetical protein